ncbi:MAG: hypothetical protein JNK46_08685 [Methylobacteriaceae bacterium]|nr:hypothetical protein [Methylobacteriaceae bacterium]
MTPILMPAFSAQMEKGALARWLRRPGEPVAAGDVIAEVETDKATMEIEAPVDGALGRILVPQGARDVPVGAALALFEPGEGPPVDIDDEPVWTGPTAPVSMIDALRDAIAEEMRRDPTILVLAEAAAAGGPSGALRGLAAEFGGGRVVEAPTSLGAAISAALGAALGGARPLLDLPGGEAAAALAALAPALALRLPVAILTSLRPDFAPPAEAAALVPSGPAEARAAIKAALRHDGAALTLLDAALRAVVEAAPVAGDGPARLGRARLLREGARLTIASYCSGLKIAADVLDEDEAGLADLIDLRSLRPADVATLTARAAATRRLIVFDPLGGACCAGLVAQAQAATSGALDAAVRLATTPAELREAASAARSGRPA